MKKTLTQISENSIKTTTIEILQSILKALFELTIYVVLMVFSLASPIGMMLLVGLIFINVRRDVKIAFADPEDAEYERKTNKEILTFLFRSCVTAFIFTILSFQIFIYITLLFWFYFIIFILMFSRVWKFHGKKRIYLFVTLISAIVLSSLAAPLVRDAIHKFLNNIGIY